MKECKNVFSLMVCLKNMIAFMPEVLNEKKV